MPQNRSVPDGKEKRKKWASDITPAMALHLVFLDESGVNTDLTRIYGRNITSKCVVEQAPLNIPTTTTVLSSIRITGEHAFTTYCGGTTEARFIDYLKGTLLPALLPGDIVIMDNMSSHHVHEVQTVLQSANIQYTGYPFHSAIESPYKRMFKVIYS